MRENKRKKLESKGWKLGALSSFSGYQTRKRCISNCG